VSYSDVSAQPLRNGWKEAYGTLIPLKRAREIKPEKLRSRLYLSEILVTLMTGYSVLKMGGIIRVIFFVSVRYGS